MEVVTDAVENLKRLAREMKGIPKKDIKRRELACIASQGTLRAVGIMPIPGQSQFITNVYQENNLTFSPVLLALLEAHEKTLQWDQEEEGGEKHKEGHYS